MFWPSAISPASVLEPSARTCPSTTRSPTSTTGRWLMQVPWFERRNFLSLYSSRSSPSSRSTTMWSAVTLTTVPPLRATSTPCESNAARNSTPVPTTGASGWRSGTDWRIMFEPIRARFASSCSRNGIIAVATLTICFGLTSM